MTIRAQPVTWLRARPVVADGLLAAVLVVLGVIGLVFPYASEGQRSTDPLAFALVLGQALPVAWRRRTPVVVLAVVTGSVFLSEALSYPGTLATFGLLIAIYSVAAHSPRRRALWAAAAFTVAMSLWLLAGWATDHPGLGLDDVISNYVAFAASFFLGDIMRRRREHVTSLEERALRLEHERAVDAERAVQHERVRIARELHDVVAHAVTVMVVQAGAARRIATSDPAKAEASLGSIEQTGREALDELRRLLGVLRRDSPLGAPADLAPQPSLARVDDLAEVDPSLVVVVRREGDVIVLPPSVEVSAYRIVQEALTNVRKHAGPATAEVVLTYTDDALEVRVVDDGRGLTAVSLQPGHGLAGMRERAALCGGDVRAGPRRGGGWQVTAHLPYHVQRAGVA